MYDIACDELWYFTDWTVIQKETINNIAKSELYCSLKMNNIDPYSINAYQALFQLVFHSTADTIN